MTVEAPAASARRAAARFEHIVRLEGVQMAFGAVQALRDIDLAIGRNEIVGLIGDNGAGKSTLIKVMTGVLRPTAGTIWVRDQKLDLSDYSVRMAHELSIETVYQDKSLGEQQPLWRNFFVGRQLTNRWGFIDVKAEKRIAGDILQKAIGFRGVGISADSTVRQLSGGERQGIAITRALHFEAELIILDEPTMALSLSETRKVLDFIANIPKAGKAGIFIDHNIFHVYPVVDRIVVLDRGMIAGQFNKADVTLEELIDRLYLVARTGRLAATQGGAA